MVQWPHPGIWRIGFLTGHVSPELKAKMKTAGVKGKPTVTLVQGVEWGQYKK